MSSPSEREGAQAPAEPADRRHPLPIGQALILGALHGPAELLPISSSGHIALVPWLACWDYAHADPELRKAFEVVLHAGTAAALLITLRGDARAAVRGTGRQLAVRIGLSVLPPAAIGFALERPIERHLGAPATIAAGLVGGSVVMALADRTAQERDWRSAAAVDALWLGIAQAGALMPGVSRNGATLAAARMRRFTRADASKLSAQVAVPVIAGATALKSFRLHRRGLPPGSATAMAAGALASLASTLASTWLVGQVQGDRSLLPYAVYRLAIAAMVVARLRAGGAGGAGPAAPSPPSPRPYAA